MADMVTSKSEGGWVVIVRGWGFVTASNLLSYDQACSLQKRLWRSGLKARLRRHA